jgi:predicted RNA-binding protein with PUA-like domain
MGVGEAMNRWWSEQPKERYWLEATDREDGFGDDLRAPELDESGKENWRYGLFKEARIGDVVLHYDKSADANGIIGWSKIIGPATPAPITWGARGTYAREKGIKPHGRSGYIIQLDDFEVLVPPLGLDEIRKAKSKLHALVTDLERRYGKPLYFPFELSAKRPVRLLQGYAFKLPAAFLKLFPSLASIEGGIGNVGGGLEHAFQRNPPWTRDELILALELYMRNRQSEASSVSRYTLNRRS